MTAFKIETLTDAQNLVNICNKYPFNIDIIYSTQIVDGKSILGVSSLLGNYVSVVPITDDKDAVIKFENDIKPISHCY
jgi:phosphotransferase system HPr-like phosphotransfer protein